MTLLAGLQGILDSRNMKPADLCRLCGLSTGVMSNYMNGKRVPSIANAITIANALGVTLDELVGGKGGGGTGRDPPPRR